MNTWMQQVRSGRLTLLSVTIAAALSAGAVQATDAKQTQAMEQRAEMKTVGQIYASPSQVMLLQEKLRSDGGKTFITGNWDEATAREVRDYQKAHGLAPTGQLDTSLLSALDMGDVLEGQRESGNFLDGLLTSNSDRKANPTSRGTPIYVSPVHVAQIQHLLHEKGYYNGQTDGVWGEGTAA